MPDTPYSLCDGEGERWPVVDGIPFLRVGREQLCQAALVALDRGDKAAALVALLADQDDWWTGSATDEGELRELIAGRDRLSLRDAMALLRLGPVADYFAYRWVDPTYLGGLALLETHWNDPANAFELACGIGHYLRELTMRDVDCVGADVVFAKCWLAKHWIAPKAEYVVFDAGARWPLGDMRFDLVMCHDAFYFLPEQRQVAERLRGLLSGQGLLAVSHLHNSEYRNGAKGPARPLHEWLTLFPDCALYDEDELVGEALHGGTPRQTSRAEGDIAIEAYSLVEGETGPAHALDGLLTMPPANAPLRPNPLLKGHDAIRWPSERWREEYGRNCWWAKPDDGGSRADPVRSRQVVDLPERW